MMEHITKMKSSKNEQAISTVGRYLRRRQYSDSDVFKKTDFKLHQPIEEMTIQGMVCAETGVRNAISFSSISGDATAIDQQYNRLKVFVTEASEPFKCELTYVLFPMFVHLYLELISNGQKTAAQKFHSRHSGSFATVQNYKSVVSTLSSIQTMQDLSTYPNVKDFRENKHTVCLCEDTLEYLMKFLRDTDNIILLQLFNLYIDLEVRHRDYNTKLHLYEDRQLSVPQVTKGNQESEKQKACEAVLALKQAIKRVSEEKPCLPSICLYSFHNAFQGLSSVDLWPEGYLLAGGFEDSSVRVWSLTSSLLQYRTGSIISRVPLACDESGPEQEIKENEVVVMRGHGGPVYSLGFAPQSNVLLSCSEDTTVRAWNLSTFTNVCLYRGHGYPVWDIDVSPLEIYFATASRDHTARIWMLDRTFPLRILAGHNLDVDAVKFHPNNTYLATGSSDRTVRLWSIQEGRMVRLLTGHRGSIFTLAFSPNGQLLASAGEDRRIKVWDLASGSQIKELRGHTDTVYSLCFNGDSSLLASGGLEHTVRLWDVRTAVSHSSHASSVGTTTESRTSPELLASFPTKSNSIQMLQYTKHNLLMAVGMTTPGVS